MADSDSDRFPGPLRLRKPPQAGSATASDTTDSDDILPLLDRWLGVDTLTGLCSLLYHDLHLREHVTKLLVVLHSDDVARMWAVEPQDDDLIHAVDGILGNSPGRMDLLAGGRGRVSLTNGPVAGEQEHIASLGFTQSALVTTTTPIRFSVYCAGGQKGDSPGNENCLTDSSLWPAIQLVLQNMARLEHLRALSHIDSVTGIHNRSYFNMRLVEEVARAHRYKRPLSLAAFDIDHFKTLNDTYGHQTGDAILRQLAEYVRWTIRSIDVFCRLGGDEFAVLMPDADVADCSHFAERLLSVLTAQQFTFDRPGQVVQLSISMGAAVYPTHATEHERLLWCADMSLLEAKHRGRGQFLLYESSFGAQPARHA